MNRFLVFLGGSLLVAGTAHAQFGLRVGGSITKLHTTNGANIYNHTSSLAGFQVGATYQVPLTSWLALVPEVQYSLERSALAQASYAVADVGFTADTHLRLQYLNVPLLLRAALGPVYVEAGAQGSFLVSGRQTGTQTVFGWQMTPTTYEISQGVTDQFRRFDVGPCVGVGLKLPAGLGVSVRAYRGLVTLNHERSIFDGEYQRQTVQASLTYQLSRQ